MRCTLIFSFLVVSFCTAVVTADEPEVLHLTDSSVDRKPVKTIVPAYPELARRERVEGEVQVCFNIKRDGTTHRAKVRKSTNRIFERPALRAVRTSTYQPLPEGNKPSGIKTCRTFRFHLNPVAIEKLVDQEAS